MEVRRMNHPVLINHGTHTLIDVIKTPIFDAYGEPSPYFARLLTLRYYCADGIQHYDKLEIELHDKDKYYFTFARNSPNIPPMMYVKQNNQDFIITSGDYQCISIYNITTKQFTDYIYKDDRDYIHFRGFCPLEYKWTEES